MPYYVPVGPRGILFRIGMIWTRWLGGMTYWSARRRAYNRQSLDIYPMLHSPSGVPRSTAPINVKIGWRSETVETAAQPFRAILPFDPTHTGHTTCEPGNRATPEELECIRVACASLHADAEITELVLASHERDRTKLEEMLNTGNTLDD